MENNQKRLVGVLIAAVAATSLSGCHLLGRLGERPDPAPVIFTSPPTSQDEILAALDRNTRGVRQLKSEVRVHMKGSPQLSGPLIFESPRRLRLKVGVAGVPGVDIGSNDELFWIWTKSSLGGQTPAIYFARHDEFAASQLSQQLQIKPQWIIDALGLVDIAAQETVRGPVPRSDGRVELIVEQKTPHGHTLSRRLVIEPQYGWIQQVGVYIDGRRVMYANSTEHRYYPDHRVSLPGHIEIHVYDLQQQEAVLAVRLWDHQINKLFVGPSTWSLPSRGDVPQINLTELPVLQSTNQAAPSSAGAYPARNAPPRRAKLRGLELLDR